MKQGNSLTFNYCLVFISFLLAFAMMMIPVNESYTWIRPEFVLLTLIFWVVNLPAHVGIFVSFVVGLCFDLVSGLLFGSTGLCLALIAFITFPLSTRLRIYQYSQQFTIIFLLVSLFQVVRLWIQFLIGHPPLTNWYWFSVLSSTLAWPLVYGFLSNYQRVFNVT